MQTSHLKQDASGRMTGTQPQTSELAANDMLQLGV